MNEKEHEISRMLSEFPYLPSPIQAVDVALDLADLNNRDVFTDLGCGDGSVLIRATEKFSVFSVGFELDPRLITIARKKVKEAGLSNMIDIVHTDFFRIDVSRFDVIYVYPFPAILKALSLKLIKEASGGTRILVLDYPLEKLSAYRSERVELGKRVCTVYLYLL